MMKKTLMTAGAVAVLLLTGACGGGDDRPSKADLSSGLQDADESITQEIADCFADLLVESDISDEGLNALAEQDEDYKESKDDTKAMESIQDKVIEDCVSGAEAE